jgi:hypothetical protein
VAVLVAVTVTPGSVAPDASDTFPLRAPLLVWAKLKVGSRIKMRTKERSESVLLM